MGLQVYQEKMEAQLKELSGQTGRIEGQGQQGQRRRQGRNE